MVSAPLKNIRQIGSFPQGSGWKFQKSLSCHHLENLHLRNPPRPPVIGVSRSPLNFPFHLVACMAIPMGISPTPLRGWKSMGEFPTENHWDFFLRLRQKTRLNSKSEINFSGLVDSSLKIFFLIFFLGGVPHFWETLQLDDPFFARCLSHWKMGIDGRWMGSRGSFQSSTLYQWDCFRQCSPFSPKVLPD